MVSVFSAATEPEADRVHGRRRQLRHRDALRRSARRPRAPRQLTTTVSSAVEAAQDSVGRLDLQLKGFVDAQGASDALSASAHNAVLPWKRADDRHVFVSQCNYCHQVGNSTTRAPRSHEAVAVHHPQDGGLPRDDHDARRGSASPARSKRASTASRSRRRTTTARPPNSPAPRSRSGRSATPSRSSTTWTWPRTASSTAPTKATTSSGCSIRPPAKWRRSTCRRATCRAAALFSGMHLAIGIFTGNHGPHSMAPDDGRPDLDHQRAVVHADVVRSGDEAVRDLRGAGRRALSAHGARGRNDIVWFTIVASNQIGRFDPKTEQMTVMRLPSQRLLPLDLGHAVPDAAADLVVVPGQGRCCSTSPTTASSATTVLAFPYGIDVNPKDGSIWYAKLYANRIGRIDPKTLQITEWETPMAGPRRRRFDADGIFWVPSFDEGAPDALRPGDGAVGDLAGSRASRRASTRRHTR